MCGDLFQTLNITLQYNLLNQSTLLYKTYNAFQIDYIKLGYTTLLETAFGLGRQQKKSLQKNKNMHTYPQLKHTYDV